MEEQVRDTIRQELLQPVDSLDQIEEQQTGVIDTDNFVFDTEVEVEEEDNTGVIDTDNYVFDTEALEETKEEEQELSILRNFRSLARESEINGPYSYQPRVGFDNIVFSWVIDPLIGFGSQAEVRVNDLLENHKF